MARWLAILLSSASLTPTTRMCSICHTMRRTFCLIYLGFRQSSVCDCKVIANSILKVFFAAHFPHHQFGVNVQVGVEQVVLAVRAHLLIYFRDGSAAPRKGKAKVLGRKSTRSAPQLRIMCFGNKKKIIPDTHFPRSR